MGAFSPISVARRYPFYFIYGKLSGMIGSDKPVNDRKQATRCIELNRFSRANAR